MNKNLIFMKDLKYRAICPLCGKAFDSRKGKVLDGKLVCPDCFKDHGQYVTWSVYDGTNQDEDNDGEELDENQHVNKDSEANTKEFEKKQYLNFVPKVWTECYKLPLHLVLYGVYAFDADGSMALSCFNYKYDERGNYMAGERERIKHIIDVINGEKPSDFEPEWELDENETCQINYKGEFQFLVRGWGHLTGCGGLNLPEELAAEMQDGFINYILDRLNGR